MECEEPIQVRVTFHSSQGIWKVQIIFSACTGGSLGQTGTVRAEDYIFSMEKETKITK